MDRISQAIELAREDRSTAFDEGTAGAYIKQVDYSAFKSIEVDKPLLRRNKILYDNLDTTYANAFRQLRTQVLSQMEKNRWQTIGISSPTPNSGKSLTAINLGFAIALQQNQSAVVVDCDFQSPSLHRLLGLTGEYSSADFIIRDADIEDIGIRFENTNFSVLPCYHRQGNASEILTSAKLQTLISCLKFGNKKRYCLLDLPSISEYSNVISVATKLDAMLLIVEDGKTQAGELKMAMHALKEANILGYVLNKS